MEKTDSEGATLRAGGWKPRLLTPAHCSRCHCGPQACHLLVLAQDGLSAWFTPSPPSATPQPSQPTAAAHLHPLQPQVFLQQPGVATRSSAEVAGAARARRAAAGGQPPAGLPTPAPPQAGSPLRTSHTPAPARARGAMTSWEQPASAAFPTRAGAAAVRAELAYGWRSPIAGCPSPGETRGGSLRVGGGGDRARDPRFRGPAASRGGQRRDRGRGGRSLRHSPFPPSHPPPQCTTSPPPLVPHRARSARPGASPSATMSK